jgi:hypothetical protein
VLDTRHHTPWGRPKTSCGWRRRGDPHEMSLT